MTPRPVQPSLPGILALQAPSEKELQAGVIQLARWLGYRVAHVRNVMQLQGGRRVWTVPIQQDGRGFPDLILVHPHQRRVLWRELKSATGRLTAAQVAWADDLIASGADYAVWTPADWPDRIQADLEGRRRA